MKLYYVIVEILIEQKDGTVISKIGIGYQSPSFSASNLRDLHNSIKEDTGANQVLILSWQEIDTEGSEDMPIKTIG